MNPILVFYHRKLVQQSDAAIRSNQLETKKVKHLCTRAGNDIGLIKNERICWFHFLLKDSLSFSSMLAYTKIAVGWGTWT